MAPMKYALANIFDNSDFAFMGVIMIEIRAFQIIQVCHTQVFLWHPRENDQEVITKSATEPPRFI